VAARRPRGRPPEVRHLKSLYDNLVEVALLLEIHRQIAGPTVGAKHNVEVLNKSGIVLLVACWEAYVEDLAGESFKLLLRRAKDPNAFSTKVLIAASKALREDKDARRVWDLAGDGWRTVLRNHQGQVVRRYIGNLNTPKPDRIDELFASLLGLSSVSRRWSWRKCNPAQARARLNRLVELRGSIAHRVSTPRSVQKKDVVNSADFVGRLAVATHNAVSAYLGTALGHRPWDDYSYRSPFRAQRAAGRKRANRGASAQRKHRAHASGEIGGKRNHGQ
jgi:hypothetical protein